MSCQRRRLARDTLHHVAIAAERVDVVVEHLETGAIEIRGHPVPGDGHADAGGNPARRARGRLDAGSQTIFGMSRAFAIELSETLDVVERDCRRAQHLVYFGFTDFTPVRWSIEYSNIEA